jgi:PAT family beta-lactamase induction signal transducer AmpG
MAQQTTVTSRSPWTFLPSLYFAEGLPYVLINQVTTVLYVNMGIDNDTMALWTAWLYLPWVIKMFWAPVVDLYSTKRSWMLAMHLCMGIALALAGLSLATQGFFFTSLAVFFAAAFISATYDIATDGFYMLALTEQDQALFTGIRSGFYRLAMVFGTGVLVILAGKLEVSAGAISLGWTYVLDIAAVLFLVAFLYHAVVLPRPAADGASRQADPVHKASFLEIVRSYVQQEKIGVIVAFILFYRLGEAMMLKMVAPFLRNAREVGGLGLTTSEYGLVYGTVGIICMVLGGVLGGWLISRFGLKRCIWPMVLAMHLPDLFFVYMAYAQPAIGWAYPLVALEQFGYGLGFTVFTVYLMYSANGRYKTSHYAISTGIMALGMMIPTALSGKIQQAVGYKTFFIIVCLMTIPGMLTIPFIPKNEKRKSP